MASQRVPRAPDTGALVEVNGISTFTLITDGLNQPTSLEIIGNTAFVVTLGGEVWKIEGVLPVRLTASRLESKTGSVSHLACRLTSASAGTNGPALAAPVTAGCSEAARRT